MKIAIFSDTFLPQINGVATISYKAAAALSKLGHEVSVFVVSKHNVKSLKDVCGGQFNIVSLPSVGFPFYPGERIALPLGFAVKKIKRFSPQIIHSHTPFALGWEAVLAAKLFKIPIVGTHHTFFDHYLRHIKMDYEFAKELSWKYVVAYYNNCDLTLSPTYSLAENLALHGLRKPAKILPNSVDTDFFAPLADQAAKNKLKAEFGIRGMSLVYMGRLSYEKSINQLLEAFRLATRKFPELKLLMIGDGPEKTSLQKLAGDLKISDNVIFAGALTGNKLVEGLQASDIFVTASKSENMPMSVLEAMSAGLPIIAPAALGMAEIVRNGENGFLFPPDHPEDMAQKISALVGDSAFIQKFSGAARRFALDYSQLKITESLESIYKKLL